ncbi:hypothetical protein [Fructilactobacillus fructivorans]|uniref:Uncharacterized protein n=1 Tax=Fructilactobacillus fructivorans TaxID=1614 RepID=A0AAE6TVJ3_9LACO|nr:hypothetical protein [Fructilactobacillus fructivorans]KRK58097.1 hypothetical protein FC73_GL000475 [Fructilactobacillus fructivorans]KRN41326.1 hypothetical protein IV51_GL000647 [Fructilactobacillus fructivorans]QFX92101.1 hypothetical protein LF543_00220 [Fructilactobacillus fructivorans]RDV65146.1 hypothetical protein DXU76_03950 [Fructilactobacillus fructivorans]
MFKPILLIITVIALIIAGYLYWTNRDRADDKSYIKSWKYFVFILCILVAVVTFAVATRNILSVAGFVIAFILLIYYLVRYFVVALGKHYSWDQTVFLKYFRRGVYALIATLIFFIAFYCSSNNQLDMLHHREITSHLQMKQKKTHKEKMRMEKKDKKAEMK